jgi:hypothetical protein
MRLVRSASAVGSVRAKAAPTTAPLPMAPHTIMVWLISEKARSSIGFRPRRRISTIVPMMPMPKPVADSAKGPIR